MKITVDRQVLAEALAAVARAASTRTGLQIASGLRITATDPEAPIELAATDMEMSLRMPVVADVIEPGAVVIPARLAQDIVRGMSAPTLTLELPAGDERLVISSQSARYVLHTYPLADFPRLPEIDHERLFELDRATFSATVSRVVRAASTDESRPVLTGVLVQIQPGRLTMAATDSYRLAVKETPLPDDVPEPIDVIIPARALAEAVRLADASGARSISFGVDTNHVVLGVDGAWLTSRKIDGQFPNFRALRPEKFEHEVSVQRVPLGEASRRIGMFARNLAPARVRFAPGELRLSAVAPDVGEASEELESDYHGDVFEIGFNAHYLRDGVELVEGDLLRFQLTTPVRPAVLLGPGDDFWYVLMPMRLS